MSWKKTASVLLALSGLSFTLSACGQSGGGGHMMSGGQMGGGMMGGGMMMQTSPANVPPELPDPQSEGAQLVTQYCGQCHAPPAPSAHKAMEWPKVVERMNGHMIDQSMSVPDSGKLQVILEYLQQHAGDKAAP